MLNQPFDDDRASPGARPVSEPPPIEPPAGRGIRIAMMIGIPIIVLVGVFFWLHPISAPPPPTVLQAAPVAPPDPIAAEAAAQAKDQLEATRLTQSGEVSDEKLRQKLSVLSAEPRWLQWLAQTPGLVDSASVIIANVSDDEDPRKRMAPLHLAGAFETVEQGGQTFEAPASMHRFDDATDTIASLDARALTPIWSSLHALISVAYHAVARPGVSVDRAASNALKRIENTQIPAQPIAIKQVGKLWLYADPDVEREGSVEKLLLRMGPTNAHKLQQKARELRAALSLP
jgi:hypothetical protein